MIYRATRHSRSDGFEWESGTPLNIQRCSDVLRGCRISDRPYYVISGHEALRVTISEGEHVDSRENRLFTAEELSGNPNRACGIELVSALVSGVSGQGTVVLPDRSTFEAALRYAARHLPRSRTGHIIISENAPALGTTVQLVFRSGEQMQPPAWTEHLPVFSEPAEGAVQPAEDGSVPRWDDLYDLLVKANSNNHSVRLLHFIAFACGAEAGSNELPEYAGLMQLFTPGEPLIRRFFEHVDEKDFDIPMMLPILYSLSGERADRLLAAQTRKYLTSAKLREYLEQAPVPYPADMVTAFAEAFDRSEERFSLEHASVPELFAVYRYVTERDLSAEDLRGFLTRDDNSRSMVQIVQAADQLRSGSQDGLPQVQGLMPAILYWFDELDQAQCQALYGSEQAAAKMITQVRMMILPKRMQKLDFKDDLYIPKPKPKKTRLRDAQHFRRFIMTSCIVSLLMLGAGLTGGWFLGRRSAAPAAPGSTAVSSTTTVPTSTTAATVTTLLTTTTQPQTQLSGVRTQKCRMDDETQTLADLFLTVTGLAPAGTDVSQGIVYYNIPAEELAKFSPEALPSARYLIPYRNDESAGILCLAQKDDGSLYLEQSVPADADGNLPDAWFDLNEIERMLDARTAEPSDVRLLTCPGSPYRRLVCFVSGGETFVMPDQFVPELAEDRAPLTSGAAYRLADYLNWLTPQDEQTAETTAPPAWE